MVVAPSSVSTSTIISTLLANLALFGVFVGCFIVLRLKFKRIYSPKSSFDLVPEEKKPELLPKDPFRWIFILLTKPDSFFLQMLARWACVSQIYKDFWHIVLVRITYVYHFIAC